MSNSRLASLSLALPLLVGCPSQEEPINPTSVFYEQTETPSTASPEPTDTPETTSAETSPIPSTASPSDFNPTATNTREEITQALAAITVSPEETQQSTDTPEPDITYAPEITQSPTQTAQPTEYPGPITARISIGNTDGLSSSKNTDGVIIALSQDTQFTATNINDENITDPLKAIASYGRCYLEGEVNVSSIQGQCLSSNISIYTKSAIPEISVIDGEREQTGNWNSLPSAWEVNENGLCAFEGVEAYFAAPFSIQLGIEGETVIYTFPNFQLADGEKVRFSCDLEKPTAFSFVIKDENAKEVSADIEASGQAIGPWIEGGQN